MRILPSVELQVLERLAGVDGARVGRVKTIHRGHPNRQMGTGSQYLGQDQGDQGREVLNEDHFEG